MFQAIELGLQTMLLGMEASSVIGLRMKRMLHGGPTALVEANCMILEKTAALAEAGATLLGGGSVRTVVGCYRGYVRANELRLA
jgi:hypothetical protein